MGEGFFNKNWPLVGLNEEVGWTITYLNLGQAMGLGLLPITPHVFTSCNNFAYYIF
jgi:hypothetical protein